MLALTRRALAYVRPRAASSYSSSYSSPCLRRMQFSGNSVGAFKKPVRSYAALAIAVSWAAAGSLFTSQATPSESRHPSLAVIASVPPSATTYATSGVVPSGASPLVLSYSAACEASNDPIEDRFIVASSHSSNARFLCVFDGHGGPDVAEYVARALPSAVDAELVQLSPNAVPSMIEDAISRAFVALDAQLSLDMIKPGGEALRRPGACALLAVERRGWLHVAHAGDCRAVVTCGKGERILLATRDHNAKEVVEQQQLRVAHPGEDDVVLCKHPTACYVKGRLQPTRAFGDFHLKSGREWRSGEWVPTRVRPGPFTPPCVDENDVIMQQYLMLRRYITAKPSTSSLQLPSAPAAVVILATDGIWDEMSSEAAARVAADAAAAGGLPPASAIMNAAFSSAAASSRMTVGQLKSVPPGGTRRRLVDDCTVVVGVFGASSKL